MSARPRVLTKCVAHKYAGPCERIVEVSDGPTGLGCLIAISRTGPTNLHVSVYRRDVGVSVSAAEPEGAPELYRARFSAALHHWIVERVPPRADQELSAIVHAGERAAKLMAAAMNEAAAAGGAA